MLAAAEAASKAAKRRRGPGPSSQAAMFQELESAELRFNKSSKEATGGLQHACLSEIYAMDTINFFVG